MVLHGDVFGAAELRRFTEPWKGLGSEMLRSLTHDAGFILEILARVYMRLLLNIGECVVACFGVSLEDDYLDPPSTLYIRPQIPLIWEHIPLFGGTWRVLAVITWEFSRIWVPYFGVLIIGVLLFKVLY